MESITKERFAGKKKKLKRTHNYHEHFYKYLNELRKERHYRGEKYVQVKKERSICLVNLLNKNSGIGVIVFIGAFGNEGVLNYEVNRKEKYITIADIRPNKKNQGIGTEALKYLEEIAKNENINYLTGRLLAKHPREMHRLERFYKKNNYKIKNNKIIKILI